MEFAIVPFGPNVISGCPINQLRSEAHAVATFANAAFEDVARPKITSDLSDVFCLALVAKHRIPGDHMDPTYSCQSGNDVFRDAISKIIILASRHVVERQDRDTRPAAGQKFQLCGPGSSQRKYPHRPSDIFYLLLASALKENRNFALGVLMD